MFNLPNLSFLQTPEWQQYIQGIMAGDTGLTPPWMDGGAGGITKPVPTNSYKVDGSKYTGPFANQDVNPFRTVEGAGQYGAGLNASAGQLYNHFSDKVNRDRQNGLNTTLLDYGFRRAAPPQSIEDFLNRRNPQTTPVQPPATNPPPPNPNTNTAFPNFGGNGGFNPAQIMRSMPTMQSFDKMAPLPNGGGGALPPKPPNMSAEQYMAICGVPPQGGGMMTRPTAPNSPQQSMFDRNNIFGQMGNINSNFQPPVAPTVPPAMTRPPMMRGAI